MLQINTPDTVKNQYSTSTNLNTRISIHEKYSTNKQGFLNWILSHCQIPENSAILELGCGTGAKLLLTDISEGMLTAAKETLGEHSNISYEMADIMALPYENDRFNIVIANMMLYHVPDLDKGLSEVRRVLKEGGCFYCATFGENGIVPYISNLLKEYGAEDNTNKIFTLQNGANILKNYFSNVQRLDYEDSLRVTNIDDILDYIYSMSGMLSITGLDRAVVKNVLEKNTNHGVLNIHKEN